MSKRSDLSAAEARRIALAAQGLAHADDPARIDIRHVRRELQRMRVLQLDYVNVLVPAQLMVLYARLGPWETSILNQVVYGRSEFVEHWAHEASIVPVEAWPLLGYRRRAFRPWPNSPITKLRNKTKYLRECIEIIRENGPSTASDMPPAPRTRRRAGDWHRSLPRWALEVHFGRGDLVACDRLPNFQRVYDLPERVIPEAHYRDHGKGDSQRQLILQAARALGVATLQDLADYWRMSPVEAKPQVQALEEEGLLEPVSVEGWDQAAWRSPDARLPRRADRCTLLSPFDPLVWYRPRTERLFGFHYRIEIYVPAAKRRWGYYVLPFLMDDRLVARVDLKANRKACRLDVPAAHYEAGVNTAETAAALARELDRLAGWLNLESIRVGRRGNLARELGAAVRGLPSRR